MDIAKLEEEEREGEMPGIGKAIVRIKRWRSSGPGTFSYPDLIYSADIAPLDARSNRDYRPAALIRNSKYSINFTAAAIRRSRGVGSPCKTFLDPSSNIEHSSFSG